MAKLRERHGIEQLELERASDRTPIEKTLADVIEETEYINTKNLKMILAVGKTVYQGQKMNIWMDVIPSR